MKRRILMFLALVLAVGVAFAQQATVELKFKGTKYGKVAVQLPVNGLDFYPSRIEEVLDQDSTLLINVALDRMASLYVVHGSRSYQFYIEPGKTSVTIDLGKKREESITYTGRNAEGQLLMNAKAADFFQNKAILYRRADSTASGIMEKIKADEAKDLQPYAALLQAKKISKAFFERMEREINVTYMAVAAYVATDAFFASLKPDSKVVFKPEFAALWSKVYANDPANRTEFLSASNFYEFARYYADYYLGAYQQKLKGTYIDRSKLSADQRLALTYANMEKAFKDHQIKEYVLANFLMNEIYQKDYQAVLVDLFNQFNAQYPKSKFSPFLQASVNEIIAYHDNARKGFSTDQKLIANYSQVNSFAELKAMFKDKTVFVDLWATWCGPCKDEFAYGKALEEFLKSKGVEMLYISMDNEQVDQQWKDMVKYYQLAGHHIRTNAALQKDLINQLWDGRGYSIPRYLILKNGELVVGNALRPSDQDALYAQISKYL